MVHNRRNKMWFYRYLQLPSCHCPRMPLFLQSSSVRTKFLPLLTSLSPRTLSMTESHWTDLCTMKFTLKPLRTGPHTSSTSWPRRWDVCVCVTCEFFFGYFGRFYLMSSCMSFLCVCLILCSSETGQQWEWSLILSVKCRTATEVNQQHVNLRLNTLAWCRWDKEAEHCRLRKNFYLSVLFFRKKQSEALTMKVTWNNL